MNSLKKTLALALVFVMAFGLMISSSAADFSDAKDVQYTEAVEVMTGIGAINGLPDGSFNPDGKVTRAQAAKMIAYATLGPKIAENLKATGGIFTDVPANFWGAPFIEYCYSRGIVNGKGSGKFVPNGDVTTYELAKMILTAAGYGKNNEYVGNSWLVNVAIDATDKGVFNGLKDADYADAATREEAALMIFNGVSDIDVVAFSKDTETYTALKMTVGAEQVPYTIGEQKYGLKKTDATVNGVGGYTWTNGNASVKYSSFIVTDNVLGTSKNGTAFSDLTTKGNAKLIAELAKDAEGNETVVYFYNGVELPIEGLTVTQAKAKVANKGVIVNFISTNADAKAEKVTIIDKKVTTLSGDAKLLSDGTVIVPGVIADSDNVEAKNVPGYNSLVKDDVVLWYKDGTGVYNIEKAEAVTAQLTQVSSETDPTYTIGGVKYKVSGLTGANFGTIAYNTDKIYYLDDAGYIVLSKDTPDTTPATTVYYGFALAYNSVAYEAPSVFGAGKAASEKVQLVDSTGTTVVLDTNVTVSGITTKFVAPNAWRAEDATFNKLIAYTLTADGKIASITEASVATVGDVEKGKPYSYVVDSDDEGTEPDTTVYATSKTLFFYYETDGTVSVKVFTGYSNALTTTTAKTAGSAFTNKAVAVEMTTIPGATVKVDSYALVVDPTFAASVEKIDGVNTYIYTLNALSADGSELTLKWKGDAATEAIEYPATLANKLYSYTVTNGYVTAFDAVTIGTKTVSQVDADFFVDTAGLKLFDDDTAFYKISKNALGAYVAVEKVDAITASIPTVSTTTVYYTDGTNTTPATVVFFMVADAE